MNFLVKNLQKDFVLYEDSHVEIIFKNFEYIV